MEFRSALIVLSLVPVFGCGGSGTKPDWELTLFDGSDNELVESVGRLGRVTDNGDNYLLYATDYNRNPVNFFTEVSHDGQSAQTVDTNLSLSYSLYSSASGLMIDPGAVQFAGDASAIASTVKAVDQNGDLAWQRTITSGMASESSLANTDSISISYALADSPGSSVTDAQILVTGLDSQGGVTWQTLYSEQGVSEYDWDVFYDQAGKGCLLMGLPEAKRITCYELDGSEKFATTFADIHYHRGMKLENNLVLMGYENDQIAFTLVDAMGNVSDTLTVGETTLFDILSVAETSDGRVHAVQIDYFQSRQYLFSFSWEDNNQLQETTREYALPQWSDINIFNYANAHLSADGQGNLYMTLATEESVTVSGRDAKRARGEVIKIAPDGSEVSVVVGKWSTYNHKEDGTCVKRCDYVPGAEFLDSLKVLEDGTLFLLWADSRMELVCDVGLCVMIVKDVSTWNLARYSQED